MARINNARNFAGTEYVTTTVTNAINSKIVVSGNVVVGSVGHIVENLIGTGESSYKLNTNVIPDLAITQVYIWDASAAVVSGNSATDAATLLAGIKGAITADGVQRGDVVVVTSDNNTDGRADLYAGSYIFIADVAAKASIVAANWKRMYVPTGLVRTVNSVSPDAGGNVNVYTKANNQITIDSINLANKSWISDGTDTASRSSAPSINGTTGAANVSLYSFVKALNTDLGATGATDTTSAFGKLYNLTALVGTKPVGSGLTATVVWNAVDEVHNLITDGTDTGESTTVYARLAALEGSIGTGTIGEDIGKIKTDLASIETALEGVCKIESVTKSIPQTASTVDGVTVDANGVVTVASIGGIVLAVIDNEGAYVGPDITNNGTTNTLIADFGALANIPASYTWKIYYTGNPSVVITVNA